jgi:hypothetical protein
LHIFDARRQWLYSNGYIRERVCRASGEDERKITNTMLTEFDQTTIANMTAALDFVCKKIPADKDTDELRKRVADELVRCARLGRRSLIDLQQDGMKVVEETVKPARSNWFRWSWRS